MKIVPVLKAKLGKSRRLGKYYLQRQVSRLNGSVPEAYPDFICIGAARSGTTWLYDKLIKHPDFYKTREKEIHFFDEPFLGGEPKERKTFYPGVFDLNDDASWRWYALQFQHADGRIKGDITPDYALLSDDRIARLCEEMPSLKVVYIMRNPIARAWSGAGLFMYRGHGVGLDELPEKQIIDWVMEARRLANGSYQSVIKKWENHIPSNRIKYIFYDDLRANPAGELADILQFVGLDPARTELENSMGKRINSEYPKKDIPEFVKEKLIDFYRDDIHFLENKFSRSLSDWLE